MVSLRTLNVMIASNGGFYIGYRNKICISVNYIDQKLTPKQQKIW